MTASIGVMGGKLGDIFWDLPPWITYASGFDIGCNIYVANPTDVEKEYALMARLSREATLISEESLPVFGYAWFKVAPGDFVTLKGALRFSDSNADLAVSLMERESGEAADSVATRLVAPSSSALPPAWPGAPGTSNWSSAMGALMPLAMTAMLGIVMVSASRPGEEKKFLTPGRKE